MTGLGLEPRTYGLKVLRSFWPEDCPVLLGLLGPDEFERIVCPRDLARERYRRWQLRNELMVELVVEFLGSHPKSTSGPSGRTWTNRLGNACRCVCRAYTCQRRYWPACLRHRPHSHVGTDIQRTGGLTAPPPDRRRIRRRSVTPQ